MSEQLEASITQALNYKKMQEELTYLKQQYANLEMKYDRLSELFQAQQIQGWTNFDLDDHK